MPRASVGLNEALILASLEVADEATIAAIAARIRERGRELDDGTIYVALQRMTGRGLVTARKARVVSPGDGRTREIGFYRMTADGARALDDFAGAAHIVHHLRLANQPL